jgi:histidinol phosphatase-like enzyme (inositol monophosphatase family)
MIPDQDLIDLAHHLADAAGAVLRRYYRAGLDEDDKDDGSPVTLADREAEAVMRELLAARAPTHGVVGEELGRTGEGADLVWVLDPIDGTKAFITGKPLFTTLIGVLFRGEPVLGLIDQPIVGDRWVGAVGRATELGNRPVRTRACASLSRARLSTTGPQYFTPAAKRAFDRVAARAHLVTYGGDGYQYGLVASGSLDLVIESGLKLHDFAALAAVVEGAGGVITDWHGRALDAASDGSVVAAGDPRVHAEALASLAAEPPGGA